MTFEIENLGLINGDELVREIKQWQSELFNDCIEDEIIYNTLDTVLNIIVNV